MAIRIDVRVGLEDDSQPTDGFKTIKEEDETVDDLVERVIGQLYTSLEKFEGASQDE